MQGNRRGKEQAVSEVELCFDRVCELWEAHLEEKSLPMGYYFYVFTVGDREEEQVVYVGIRETANSLRFGYGQHVALTLHHPDLEGLKKRVYFAKATVRIRDTAINSTTKVLPLLPAEKGLIMGVSQYVEPNFQQSDGANPLVIAQGCSSCNGC